MPSALVRMEQRGHLDKVSDHRIHVYELSGYEKRSFLFSSALEGEWEWKWEY